MRVLRVGTLGGLARVMRRSRMVSATLSSLVPCFESIQFWVSSAKRSFLKVLGLA